MTAEPVHQPVLTPTEVARLRRQFAQLAQDSAGFSHGFYERLFQLAPLTRALFRQHLATQGDLFMRMLGRLVEEAGQPAVFAATVQQLADLHRPHGLIREDVEPVATALLAELDARLGADFDDEARQAWSRLYHVAVEPMFADAAVANGLDASD